MSRYLLFCLIALQIGLFAEVAFAGLKFFQGFKGEERDSKDKSEISGDQLTYEFDVLNKYLSSKTRLNDADENMDYLLVLYLEHSDRKSISKSKKLKAEKLFLDLRRIDPKPIKNFKPDPLCNEEGWKILNENNRALGSNSPQRSQETGSARRRVDEIFQHYLKVHSNHCQNVYPANFIKQIETMNKEQLQRVAHFTDDLISNSVALQQGSEVVRVSKFVENEPNFDEAYIYGRLPEAVKDGQDWTEIISQRKTSHGKRKLKQLRNLYREYIVEPCTLYVKTVGPEVFEPATLESKYLQLDETNKEYCLGWARFRVCKALIGKAEFWF